ncbi:hypothetical protein D514_0108070 [Microbacterium sp. UCD-TDU]|nr:hypothetical protein D514_0108070 [Microbacterium sp. UCD-TDU]
MVCDNADIPLPPPMEDTLANTYPYISGPGALVKTLEQFRKSFPATVDAAYFKRMGIAPGNESYLINILRFLGVIDDSGAKVDEAANAFYGSDEHFHEGLTELLRDAYKPVFDELGPDAWNASRESLSHWFRMVDKTTDLIGGRQASTFLTLAGVSGNGAPVQANSSAKTTPRTPPKTPAKTTSTKKAANATKAADEVQKERSGGLTVNGGGTGDGGAIGLSVRIDINIPVGATADEYDAMFASIRKHLYPA